MAQPNLDEIFRGVDINGKGLSQNDLTNYYKSLFDNVQKWGKTSIFQGELLPLMPTMQSPPTITIGKTTTSAVDGTKVNGAVTVPITDTRLTLTHSIFESADTNLSMKPSDITLSDGSKTSAFAGLRFATDSPTFELCFHETNGVRVNVIVDGQILRTEKVRFANSGNRRYLKFDFGADVVTYGKADASIGISAGGSGHAVGDIITMSSAGGSPCTIVVAQVSGGAVTIGSVLDKGSYTVLPTGTLTQVSTTGSGTGFAITALFFNPQHSTRKMRNIEVLWTGAGRCFGIVTGANDIVQSYRGNQLIPKPVFVTDSQGVLTYGDYVGGQMPYIIAQRLGLSDKAVISGQGGTGWNKDNGTALRWSSSQRLADIIAHQGDIYFFLGSQNDLAGNQTERDALTAAVTSTLNQVRSALPNAILIGVGPIVANGASISDAIKAGFLAANDQKRTIYIDNVAEAWVTTAKDNAFWTTTSDTAHNSQEGVIMKATLIANALSERIASIIKNP